MANQQRSVIVTAIILAVILGGALVWLLNRTPAEQLATQAPTESQQPTSPDQASAEDLVSVDEANRLAQAQQPAATSAQPGGTQVSPTEPGFQQTTPSGTVSGVSTTAATGPAEAGLIVALASTLLGSGGLLLLPRLNAFRQ
jgi:hypothetical protein